jgi:phospholipid/cholesterol/gamma-HCH transport system substrate-binding protein
LSRSRSSKLSSLPFYSNRDQIAGGVPRVIDRAAIAQSDLDRVTAEFHTVEGELKAGKGSFARLDQLQARFDELTVKIDGMMDKIRSGQGTVGQLLVNPQLNEALAGTTREFQELMKGLRTNPRKFVKFKIF